MQASEGYLYQRLAAEFEARIRGGELRAGERLPSLRGLRKKLGLSLATVYQAYMDLEASGLIESRPKSGFFVKAPSLLAVSAPRHGKKAAKPGPVRLSGITAEVVRASLDPGLVQLGASTLSPELLPHKHLGRLIKGISPARMKRLLNYARPEGSEKLRRQIAARMVGLIPGCGAEDIQVTSGCMEAVSLALSVAVKPGGMVALESPTHFGFLQLATEMGLKAAAVPTDPRFGMDLAALEDILAKYPVQAVLCIPNFHNPMGSLMPDGRKKTLVELCNRKGVPLIEDDIYGEMHFGAKRPLPLKSFDRRDLVIYCSSFSKVLAPGFRVGWCVAGPRFAAPLLRLKTASAMSSPSIQQEVLAGFMERGAYERYLRRLRPLVRLQVERTAVGVRKHFPPQTRFSVPEGGNMLWMELPNGIDGVELYRRALERGVSIVPGRAFAAAEGFKNFIRISCTSPFDQRIDRGLEILGELAAEAAQ